MLDRLKNAFSTKPKTSPVLLRDVEAAPQDPKKENEVREAVANLVSSLLELERHSYEVRKKLSTMTLRVVNKTGNK